MKLKKMDEYFKRIVNHCKSVNITLIEVPEFEGCGEYDPNRRVIRYDNTATDSEVLSTLLHELGHHLDDFRNPKKYAHSHHYYGRTRMERDYLYLTAKQKQAVWDTELEAWKNARALARQLKIPLGKWFSKDETSSLNTYRSIRVM